MKKRFRKKGFVLLPVVLATFIIGMLGVGLASMYQSTFSTMSAGKAASQAKDFANVEGDYLKVTGYDDSSSVVHDWQDLSTVVGPDGASWQSKVEDTGRTQVSPTGDKVKVMKVSVRKNGELVSRYSQEVPLVDGKDVSSKAEIDSMMKVVDGQIQTLTNHVDTEVDRLDGDVAKVNSSLDALSKLVNNYHDQLVSDINAERTARESADTNLNNAVNKEVSDRKNAIAQSEAKLNQRIDDIQADIKKLHDSVNTNTANIKTNASNINTNKDNISKNASGIKTNADAIADINSRLATLRTDFDALSTKNTGVTNRVKAIEDRLNGNEFIKNATTGNSIKIGWDASSKALYGMVDGNKVPLSSQDGSINYEFLRNQNLKCTISANIENSEAKPAYGVTFYDTTANGLKFSVVGGDLYTLHMYKNNKKYVFMITDDASFFQNEYADIFHHTISKTYDSYTRGFPIPIYQTTVHDIVVGDPYSIITKMSYSKEDVELWISNFLSSKGYNEPIDFIWEGLDS